MHTGFGLGQAEGRGGDQGGAFLIVHDLGVDVHVGAVHHQTGTFGGTLHLFTNADLAALTGFILGKLHDAIPTYFLPPDLPTLRRMISVVYLIPLPL